MKPLTGVRFCLYCLSVLSLGGVPACGATPARNTTGQKGAKSTRARVGRVQTGLDVLEAEKFAPLRGKHVGLITNHTGVDFQGRTKSRSLHRKIHPLGFRFTACTETTYGQPTTC